MNRSKKTKYGQEKARQKVKNDDIKTLSAFLKSAWTPPERLSF